MSDERDHPSLFSDEELATFHALEQSDLWQLLKRGFTDAREACFARSPTDQWELAKTWGKIELLTALLQTGPMLVLQYRHMAAQAAEKSREEAGSADAWRYKQGE